MEQISRGMNLPAPRFRIAPMSDKLSHVSGFHDLQTYFPALSKLYRITKHQTNQIWLDSNLRITGIDISGTSGPCKLQLVENTDASNATPPMSEETREAFLKVTHLLDPIRWMKGEYSIPKQRGLPWHSKTWAAAWTKIQDSSNQAYVEVVASYALGRLRDAGISPHFNQFYGAFCATADLYRYNLTEEFSSFRNTRWFWHGQKRGLYRIHVSRANNSVEPIESSVLGDILREPSDFDTESGDDSVEGDEEYVSVNGDNLVEPDTTSLHSDEMDNLSFEDEKGGDDATHDTDTNDDYRIYAEIRDFPVMMIGIESNQGTMDALLDNYTEVGALPGSDEWEIKWSAWIFQIIAALSAAQAVFAFTHNDLHTNNIVWTATEEEFMYYTKRSGEVFKVPTFGKLFRVIDFGRAIFSINSTQFISDDFKSGNDAEGQYCFKPLHPKPAKEVGPNPSFDLSRLAVSLFDSLFPEHPPALEGGAVLSSEEDMEVTETVSPLYNALWAWMIDDEGHNILVEPSGEERFPDFDLYKHIAAHVHCAIPAQQLSKPAFDRFQVNPSEVGDVKKWLLFV